MALEYMLGLFSKYAAALWNWPDGSNLEAYEPDLLHSHITGGTVSLPVIQTTQENCYKHVYPPPAKERDGSMKEEKESGLQKEPIYASRQWVLKQTHQVFPPCLSLSH